MPVPTPCSPQDRTRPSLGSSSPLHGQLLDLSIAPDFSLRARDLPAVALALTLSWHVYVNAKTASEDGWRRTALAASNQEAAVLRAPPAPSCSWPPCRGRTSTIRECGERLRTLVTAHGIYRAAAILGPERILCLSGDAKCVPQTFDRRRAHGNALEHDAADRRTYPWSSTHPTESFAVAAPTRGRDAVAVVVVDAEDGHARAGRDLAARRGYGRRRRRQARHPRRERARARRRRLASGATHSGARSSERSSPPRAVTGGPSRTSWSRWVPVPLR